MSKLTQFIGGKEVLPIGSAMHIYSDQATVVVDGKTYLRSGVLADPATYPLVTVINPAGYTWTSGTIPLSTNWMSIAYGNNTYVAVANRFDNVIAAITSVNSGAWQTVSLPTMANWAVVVYGNGVFLAISTNNKSIAATSPDGIIWTQQTMPSSALNWNAACFANNQFVAVGGSGTPATSPDGITWTLRSASGLSAQVASIAYGNGLYVMVAGIGTSTTSYSTSPDGITWTLRSLPLSAESTSICFGNGLFVVSTTAFNGTNYALTSPDGITWTQRTLPMTAHWNVSVYGNGVFVIINKENAPLDYCVTSLDGITWISRRSYAGLCTCACYGAGQFIALQFNSNCANSNSSIGNPVYTPSLYFRVA